jgi:hypothetical protein
VTPKKADLFPRTKERKEEKVSAII